MPEYGRNVQRMVEYLLTIEDRKKRLEQAEAVIKIMTILTPHLKSMEDYEHKLWDHLYQLTDFKLDVDGPYPAPNPEEVHAKPEPFPYPQKKIKHRHLGKNLQSLMDRALEEPIEKREGYAHSIGYYIKLAYLNWHKEPVHDDLIRNELAVLSKGQLQYQGSNFKLHFDNRNKNNRPQHKNKNRNKGGQGNNGNNNNNNRNNRNRNFKNNR